MNKKTLWGHFLAIVTILIWGTTFVSTKTLLTNFSPEEILAYRFFGAFIILVLIYPKNIKLTSLREEFLFFLLGISGVTIYYWTENLALKYTYASNVGLIVSAIPIFTVLVAHFMTKEEKLATNLFLGFIIAMLPILIISGVSIPKPSGLTANIILNLLFLTIFASILCFIMWNKAISIVGSVKTTNYVYLVPLISLISSVLILHEKVTIFMLLGGGLIFLGIFINENKWFSKALKFNYSDRIYNKENSD